MATIKERNGKYCLIYWYKDANGERKQKWESFPTLVEAKKRRVEIEYKSQIGDLVVPKCTTLEELMRDYINLYGKEKWSLSTYERNLGIINNYILPYLGKTQLKDLNTRFIESYYQQLLKSKPVGNAMTKKPRYEHVTTSTIRDAHKILRNCFQQAIKWDLMEKNPCIYATVPKYKQKKREIWTAETLMHALEVCDDERLKLAINLSFACSLRIGELLGLTWDCVDVSPKAMETGRPSIFINKEFQRVRKETLSTLDNKDVIVVFPSDSSRSKTVRILKTPKTESSVRRVFLPQTVAEMLIAWKAEQDELKDTLGSEYVDFNLVLAAYNGMPTEASTIRCSLQRLIKEHDLPPVVFHSFRHSSVTYKLKLNGGDIKAVQGDSGHSQTSMVSEVYSHIIDDDRRRNAELFEEAFYGKNDLNPSIHGTPEKEEMPVPEGVDAETLKKVLSNPELVALLNSLAKNMG